MGKITCANVLSDMYAIGVTECDNLVLILSKCTQMTDEENDVVTKLFLDGFKENANLGGVKPICQNIVYNPWLIIGGAATSVCQRKEYILPQDSKPGDILVVTKPLGPQLASNIYRWMENEDDRFSKLENILTKDDVKKAFSLATSSMARLNRTGAILMHKYGAHAGTDITGFGLIGHAKNLAESQTNKVEYEIHTIPILTKMTVAAKALGNLESLVNGRMAETSGGLLISLPSEEAAVNFCNEIKELDKWPAWIVGKVIQGENTAKIVENPKIIDVDLE